MAVLLNGNRGRIRTSFCCPFGKKSESVQHLLLFCTEIEVAVQLHLLQISGHANREIHIAFIYVPVLLFVHFSRQWLSMEKEISCESLFADFYFAEYFSHCKKKNIFLEIRRSFRTGFPQEL